jgi:mercuric ion transport protein
VRKLGGYLLVGTALLACPCHLVLSLPVVLGLFGGTTVAAALGANTGWVIFGTMVFYFIVVLAAGACGGSGGGQPASGVREDSPAENTGGAVAADFTIETLDGKEFNLAEKRGEVVALYFMAGWCGSCIPEARVWSEREVRPPDPALRVTR